MVIVNVGIVLSVVLCVCVCILVSSWYLGNNLKLSCCVLGSSLSD